MPNPGVAPPPDVATSVAVLLERSGEQGKKMDVMAADLKGMANVYATKAELADVREDVRGIKSNIGWAAKIVLGAVIVAVLGLVIAKGGMPHL